MVQTAVASKIKAVFTQVLSMATKLTTISLQHLNIL